MFNIDVEQYVITPALFIIETLTKYKNNKKRFFSYNTNCQNILIF